MSYGAVLSMSDVCRVVGLNFGLEKSVLLGPCRLQQIVRPRMITMTLAREFTARSLPAIGRYCGGRDHSTVISAMKRVRKLSDTDPAFAAELDKLRRVLTAYRQQEAA